MPTTTLQPTSNTTPDQGGTTAVTGASNTGHSSTAAGASASASAPSGTNSASQSKSCRWSSFAAAPSGTITSVRLKLTWAAEATVSSSPANDGSATATAEYIIQYSTNGGSNWTTIANPNASGTGGASDSFDDGANVDIALSISQNISQVQVRDKLDAATTATAGTVDDSSALSSASATVTGIQIEVVTSEIYPSLVVAM